MHASELFGARLDNHVQTGSKPFCFVGSVAFVALSPEAEYEYGWLIRVHRDACKRLGRICALQKPSPRRSNEGLMAVGS